MGIAVFSFPHGNVVILTVEGRIKYIQYDHTLCHGEDWTTQRRKLLMYISDFLEGFTLLGCTLSEAAYVVHPYKVVNILFPWMDGEL